MLDWGKIIEARDSDPLKEAKLWLFEENVRLEEEKKNLRESKEQFAKDRARYKEELEALSRQTVSERRRLKEETLFFDKKMMILRAGFEQLESDRRSFEKEKRMYESKRKYERLAGENDNSQRDARSSTDAKSPAEIAARLFANVTDPVSLRKRYRDLVKIFHPDNLHGDSELVAMINKEFFRRKREE